MNAVHSLRRLGRAALLGPAPRGDLPDALEHVAHAHRAHHPDADLGPLGRAYVLAEASHRGQTRKSGDPYITHPLAVTLILAQLGAETTTLTASLLHDTVEDTDVTLEQVHADFGPEVAHLVDGVTKLEKVDHGAAAEPETFRKMLLATGSDVRVMSIKLADRLHNMRTLGVMRREKQERIARVTRDVLIPLAERLGVQALKRELEDLVFAVLQPEDHARTQALLRSAGRQGPDPLTVVATGVRKALADADIEAQVLIRPRHLVSVHRLRRKRGGEPGPLDLARLLVLVAEPADCYAVLGELHTCFTPVVSEFKDYIATPKFNLYQSLHTAFADSEGRVVEVLVRTERMHRVAEAGVIALGDPSPASGGETSLPASTGEDPLRPASGTDRGERGGRPDPSRAGWLSRLLEWQSHAQDPDVFWNELREELAQDREVTVYCDDRPVPLTAGSTVVDAAYARHGDTAHRCVGARVGGRLAALRTVLRDGDEVRLLLAPAEARGGQGPSPEWLEFARTPRARIAVRGWLAERAAALGEELASSDGEFESIPPAVTAAPEDPAPEDPAPHAPEGPAAFTPSRPDAAVRLARCCTPVPGDEVTGFPVRGGAVTVHRDTCPAVGRMAAAGRDPLRVRWARHVPGRTAGCRVTLRAEAFGHPQLLADLTETIAAQGAAVLAAAVEPPCEQRVKHTYTLHLPDAAALPDLMRAMRNVPGVYDVTRAVRRPAG